MRANESGFRVVMLACACALLFGCTAPEREAPKVTFISPAEAAELWEASESQEPVGEPFVEEYVDDVGATIVCRQAFLLRMPGGGGPVTSVSCCTGRCVLTEGSTFDDCVTSGCTSSGSTCSALSCSGGCKLSQSCRPCAGGSILARL